MPFVPACGYLTESREGTTQHNASKVQRTSLKLLLSTIVHVLTTSGSAVRALNIISAYLSALLFCILSFTPKKHSATMSFMKDFPTEEAFGEYMKGLGQYDACQYSTCAR